MFPAILAVDLKTGNIERKLQQITPITQIFKSIFRVALCRLKFSALIGLWAAFIVNSWHSIPAHDDQAINCSLICVIGVICPNLR